MDLIAEPVAKVPLGKQKLVRQRFPGRNVFVFHYHCAAGDFQTVFVEHLLEQWDFVGIALQKRPHVGHLIENIAIVGISLQQTERLHDVGKPNLQILFPWF